VQFRGRLARPEHKSNLNHSIAAGDIHVCSEQMLAEAQAKLRETQQRSEHLLHLCSQEEPWGETDRTFHDGERVRQSSSARYLLDSCKKRVDDVGDEANVKQAAVRIQSRVRGMQSRRQVAKRTKQRNDAEKVDDWRHEPEETAVHNQARNRGPSLDRRREKEEDERKHCAAVKIQARHRGMRDRQRLREEDERKHCAAVKIQSRVRGVRSREQARELERQRDHQGECTHHEIPIAKEAGTGREGVMMLEAELQKERGRDNSPAPWSPPSPFSMPSPPSISLASSVSFAEEISQVFKMNCREEDDLERATEIQEKLRSWMDEGGDRDKDKDRAMSLEKEQQTESDPIAKMQQRMEKGPFATATADVAAFLMPALLFFVADMERQPVLEQEQRERESARKEVALLRQELRIESEGLALLRRERSCARDELYKEQEARARDRSIVVELENLLAESIRREEVCREELKTECKKVLQGEASKARMEAQEEEHEIEKRRLREDAKAMEIELHQTKERAGREDDKVRVRTQLLEDELHRERKRADALEVELHGLREKVVRVEEAGSGKVASIEARLLNEQRRLAALEERDRAKIAELSLAVESTREKVLEVEGRERAKTQSLEDELKKSQERMAAVEASWTLKLEGAREQLKREREKVIMLQTQLGCLAEMHRESTTSLKILLQQECGGSVSDLQPVIWHVLEEATDRQTASFHSPEREIQAESQAARSLSFRGPQPPHHPPPHPPPVRSKISGIQISRNVRLLSPLSSPLHSPDREAEVKVGGMRSGQGGLRDLRALRIFQ